MVPDTSGKTFKTYTITDTKYTDPNGKFGTNYVIEVADSPEGAEDRFIAMALNDVDPYVHSWWYWFNANSSSLETSYNIGTGKTNTEKVKARWENEKATDAGRVSTNDIWSLVTLDANNKTDWFIPSNDEWKAFGAMSWTDNAELPTTKSITRENYSSSFGLNDIYWSSSQNSSNNSSAQHTSFGNGNMSSSGMMSSFWMALGGGSNLTYKVRFSTAF